MTTNDMVRTLPVGVASLRNLETGYKLRCFNGKQYYAYFADNCSIFCSS